VNAQVTEMSTKTNSLRYAGLLTLLIALAMLLMARLCYLYIAEPSRFPINKVNIAASYQHITHQELETVLSSYLNASYFSLPVTRLQNALNALDWVESALVERVWPDSLKIILVEKKPVAIWGDQLLTEEGQLFKQGAAHLGYNVPKLRGPESQYLEVLQVYQKLGKILTTYGLYAETLQLRDNHAWILTLANGVQIHLGKKSLETRLLRFCKAYPAVFAEKVDQLASVDLRYPRGMAVQWKQQTER
jgi:cell division protein FtsQ